MDELKVALGDLTRAINVLELVLHNSKDVYKNELKSVKQKLTRVKALSTQKIVTDTRKTRQTENPLYQINGSIKDTISKIIKEHGKAGITKEDIAKELNRRKIIFKESSVSVLLSYAVKDELIEIIKPHNAILDEHLYLEYIRALKPDTMRANILEFIYSCGEQGATSDDVLEHMKSKRISVNLSSFYPCLSNLKSDKVIVYTPTRYVYVKDPTSKSTDRKRTKHGLLKQAIIDTLQQAKKEGLTYNEIYDIVILQCPKSTYNSITSTVHACKKDGILDLKDNKYFIT